LKINEILVEAAGVEPANCTFFRNLQILKAVRKTQTA
jgi:hypothetical protein